MIEEASGCAPTAGLLKADGPAAGYMLYAPRTTTDTYLVDVRSGAVVHAWRSAYATGHAAYLTGAGDLARMEDDTALAAAAKISIPGDASMISFYDWAGTPLWRKVVNSDTHRFHHQFDLHNFDVRSGSGTLFALTAYRLECAQAVALGREICDDSAGMYVEAVLEINAAGEVVWSWYMSNHVCSDCAGSTTKVDINSGFGANRADWVHANSLVYDADADVLLLGGAFTSEVYVIDHSAPSEPPLMDGESSSLLFRYGSDRFGEQHDVRFAPCSATAAAGSLCFTVFNNGRYRGEGTCAFDAGSGAQTADPGCASEVLLVALPPEVLGSSGLGPSPDADAGEPTVVVETLFDADTVPSLLGEGGDFLRLCDASGECRVQSRFFSLILSSAALVGQPFAPGSYVSVNAGVYGTCFEVYYDSGTGAYSDVRFVYQNAAQIVGNQQPPTMMAQCSLPGLVSLSFTAASGYSTRYEQQRGGGGGRREGCFWACSRRDACPGHPPRRSG